jgi:hypothetical protein
MNSSGDLLICRDGVRHFNAVLTPGGSAVAYAPGGADPNHTDVLKGAAGWTVNGVVKWPRFAAVQANAAAVYWESGKNTGTDATPVFSGEATAATAGSLAVPIGGREVIQLRTDGLEPCLSLLCAGTLVIKWIP